MALVQSATCNRHSLLPATQRPSAEEESAPLMAPAGVAAVETLAVQQTEARVSSSSAAYCARIGRICRTHKQRVSRSALLRRSTVVIPSFRLPLQSPFGSLPCAQRIEASGARRALGACRGAEILGDCLWGSSRDSESRATGTTLIQAVEGRAPTWEMRVSARVDGPGALPPQHVTEPRPLAPARPLCGWRVRPFRRSSPLFSSRPAIQWRRGWWRAWLVPAGNMTAMTFEYPELSGKRLELLREVAPRVRRVLTRCIRPA